MNTMKRKGGAALFLLALVAAVGVGGSFVIDFVHNRGITWSLYVLYTALYVMAGAWPLCLRMKHGVVLSLATLSVMAVPFLFLVDSVAPGSRWFGPLAWPIALRAILSLWVCGLMMRYIRWNKWFLGAGLAGVFGAFLCVSVHVSVNGYIPGARSPLNLIVALFAVGILALAVAAMGYVQEMMRHRHSRKYIEMPLISRED